MTLDLRNSPSQLIKAKTCKIVIFLQEYILSTIGEILRGDLLLLGSQLHRMSLGGKRRRGSSGGLSCM